MDTGYYEQAVSEFQLGLSIPPAVLPYTSLARVLVTLKRYDEAEASARRALAADSRFLTARYALGLAAAARHQCTSEAIENLIRRKSTSPPD